MATGGVITAKINHQFIDKIRQRYYNDNIGDARKTARSRNIKEKEAD